MQLPLYQVDAFADRPFTGNPAAVVPLEWWLPDATLQSIALENNLSETAFFVPAEDGFHLRWFTPATEVDLCGHATLAAAFVITTLLDPGRERVRFDTRSGELQVEVQADRLVLDLPTHRPTPLEISPALVRALGSTPLEAYSAPYTMAVLESERHVRELVVDLRALEEVDRALIVTARGEQCDFVSRFFAPGYGIPEDPVTGSAHCTLTPYWAERLGRRKLTARQLSLRGGRLWCEDCGDRTRVGGRAVLFLEGRITLDRP